MSIHELEDIEAKRNKQFSYLTTYEDLDIRLKILMVEGLQEIADHLNVDEEGKFAIMLDSRLEEIADLIKITFGEDGPLISQLVKIKGELYDISLITPS